MIEVGAGTGYWASLLQARGVNITAYDLQPPSAVSVSLLSVVVSGIVLAY